MLTRNSLIVAGFVASAAWLVGCDDDGVRSYDVSKDEHVQPDSQISPHEPRPEPDAPVDWDVPDTWRKLDGKRTMRVATFEADGPDGPLQIAVSRLRGDAGGIVANVNRWRGQLGLGPMAGTGLDEHVQPLAAEGGEAFLVDLVEADPPTEGDQPRQIIVAVVPLDGATWFVKAIGKSSIVGPQKDAIAQFARSFRVHVSH